jgi:hypothetical protein
VSSAHEALEGIERIGAAAAAAQLERSTGAVSSTELAHPLHTNPQFDREERNNRA